MSNSLILCIEIILSVLFCASRRKKEPKNAVSRVSLVATSDKGAALDLRPF